MAAAFGVWVAGDVSGAHINPAVTLAFAARRKFPWPKVLPYWGAQLAGAMAGASIVLLLYNSAINARLPSDRRLDPFGKSTCDYPRRTRSSGITATPRISIIASGCQSAVHPIPAMAGYTGPASSRQTRPISFPCA
jgi:glycerol uptake facilitator-like aquaporin